MSTHSHTAFTSLPVVDIADLYSDELERRLAVARELDRAARDAGFLYITGHPISPDTIDTLKRCATSFFAQPEDLKQQHYIGHSDSHSGYVPMGEERFYGQSSVDAKEAFDVVFEVPGAENPIQGDIRWPELTGFQTGVQDYFTQALALGNTLFRGFALGLGLPEDSFAQQLDAPASQLRLIHYFDSSDAPEDQQGIGAHTDYEFFTILLPTSPGLQVLNGAGEWIEVPVLPGAFVVNIGDMMEIFTNGQYVATSHRVRRLREERYSFPLFCSLNYDSVVAPHPAFCQSQAAQYDAIVCGEHLLAQTIQTFQYLQRRIERNELQLPDSARGLSSFGHQALREAND